MKQRTADYRRLILILSAVLTMAAGVSAQGRLEDYKRADEFRSKNGDLVRNAVKGQGWIEGSHRFWYVKSTADGTSFRLVDVDKKSIHPAFDHSRLAAALNQAADKEYKPGQLPFNRITFAKDGKSLFFILDGFRWTCDLGTYFCRKGDEDKDQTEDRRYGGRKRRSGEVLSPDKKWYAYERDFNLFLRSTETGEEFRLTSDGTEKEYYEGPISWAPDSKKLAAFFTKAGDLTEVYLIESSPKDQVRPKMTSRPYALPGDVLPKSRPCILTVENNPSIKVTDELFPDPHNVSRIHWDDKSGYFTFRYHERGEQLTRLIAVNASTGRARTILDETSQTFVDRYNLIVEYLEGSE
ncbi:MAG: DPP IV N-terminal domain-containing protein, partial [Candidatus Aminicenantes bacterium]|nr:DPP IV N-terminal domain-containing protein [Candidatus Aminicenantes bacterium]